MRAADSPPTPLQRALGFVPAADSPGAQIVERALPGVSAVFDKPGLGALSSAELLWLQSLEQPPIAAA